jgi:hypothetical protein
MEGNMPASLRDLEQQNPDIRDQIEEWQSDRASNGQNPTDWEAFRQHLMAIGAPDPGPEAPREFMQSALGSAAGGIVGKFTGQQPQQQERRQPRQEVQSQEQQDDDRGGGLLGRMFGGR